MITLQELEEAALAFPPRDRALLATHLLHSLPNLVEDEDDGMEAARRRDAELDADSSIGMSLEQFTSAVAR